MSEALVYVGDCREVLPLLGSGSVNCCVTSPPYWGLRDYGTGEWEGGDAECDHRASGERRQLPHGDGRTNDCYADERVLIPGAGSMYRSICARCGAVRVDAQIGLEDELEAYVSELVGVFREVRRVLRDDGTLWLNLGDVFAAGCMTGKQGSNSSTGVNRGQGESTSLPPRRPPYGLKPKDLCGVPWRVAFALQADGWYLRSDIIWCLSGGTYVYARTQKGENVCRVRDLYRLDPSTVELWNGEKWTRVLGMSKSNRRGDELQITLKSGERIACTPTHKWPTRRGLVEAAELRTGDALLRTKLPEPTNPRDCAVDEDAAWLAGLYVAEGSMSGDTIQIAGHASEEARWERVQVIAAKYGGYASRTVAGNGMCIRLYGKLLVAIIGELVSGRTAKDKGFAPVVWRYSNAFIRAMLDGYLAGDGHWDAQNRRWRLGFTRNYNLERDLRTACARLGYKLSLKLSEVPYDGRMAKTFRGELRTETSGHHNEHDTCQIVKIERAKCREVYDIGVQDEPHLFALSSGVLTHNSKPNPMPESVTDRPTKAHEYLFLLAKSQRYYYDAEAISEAGVCPAGTKAAKGSAERYAEDGVNSRPPEYKVYDGRRNKRDVWTVATKPYPEAHFATFPHELIAPCILAGSPVGGVVLDPFAGSGTTLDCAVGNGRSAVGVELNPDYAELIRKRLGMFVEVRSCLT